MTTFMPIVRDVLFFAIWFGFPIIVFLPRLKKPEDIGKRMVVSAFGTWALLILHLELIHRPVAFALAEARGNTSYDGAALSAAVWLFGWAFGVISTAVAACGYLAIQYFKRKCHENAAAKAMSSNQ